jgi:hypothetical protein
MCDRSVEDIDWKYFDKEGVEHDLLQEYLEKHKTKRHEIVDENNNLRPPHTKLTIIDDGSLQPSRTLSQTCMVLVGVADLTISKGYGTIAYLLCHGHSPWLVPLSS